MPKSRKVRRLNSGLFIPTLDLIPEHRALTGKLIPQPRLHIKMTTSSRTGKPKYKSHRSYSTLKSDKSELSLTLEDRARLRKVRSTAVSWEQVDESKQPLLSAKNGAGDKLTMKKGLVRKVKGMLGFGDKSDKGGNNVSSDRDAGVPSRRAADTSSQGARSAVTSPDGAGAPQSRQRSGSALSTSAFHHDQPSQSTRGLRGQPSFSSERTSESGDDILGDGFDVENYLMRTPSGTDILWNGEGDPNGAPSKRRFDSVTSMETEREWHKGPCGRAGKAKTKDGYEADDECMRKTKKDRLDRASIYDGQYYYEGDGEEDL